MPRVKLKDVPRYPSGKAVKPTERRARQEAELIEQRPVLVRRCMLMGWNTTPENLLRARDQRLENAAGRAYLAGWYSEDAYHGLCDYRDLFGRWSACVGAPSRYPAGSVWAREAVGTPVEAEEAPVSGGQPESEDERQRRLSAALAGAQAVLTSRQSVAINEIMWADHDWSPLWSNIDRDALKTAAQAFARHFGHRC